jgi:hypothetical protein
MASEGTCWPDYYYIYLFICITVAILDVIFDMINYSSLLSTPSAPHTYESRRRHPGAERSPGVRTSTHSLGGDMYINVIDNNI